MENSSMNIGGYPISIFKKDLRKQFKCLKCKLILRNPYRCSSCEEEYCKVCYLALKTDHKKCISKFCDSRNEIVADESLRNKRLLDEEECCCLNKDDGCNWEGALKALDMHLNFDNSSKRRKQECMYVKKSCKHCKHNFFRKDLIKHETEECKYRPEKCELCGYESTFLDVTEQHPSACLQKSIPCTQECGDKIKRVDLSTHIMDHCPNTIVPCDIYGCDVELPRKGLPTHKEQDIAKHVDVLSRELKQIKLEREQKDTLKVLPITLTVDNFIQIKHASSSWQSDILYAEENGHALCLVVHPHGVATGKLFGHVSVFLYVTKGKFDDSLQWPYEATVAVELLDQQENDHISQTITVRGVNATDNKRFGWECYTSLKRLEPRHLQNNCLKFKLYLK